MAQLPLAPNAIQVTLKGVNQGTSWQNRFHLYAQGALGATTANLATLCNSVSSAWQTHLAPLCAEECILMEVDAIELTARDSPAFYATLTPPIAGTRPGENLPSQVALVISWTVQQRYRGGHGRIYVPAGVVGDVVSGRQWNTATGEMLADAKSAATALFTALDNMTLGSVSLDLCVMSYFFGSHKTAENKHPDPVPRAQGLPYKAIGARVRGRVDTQRRRLGKELI